MFDTLPGYVAHMIVTAPAPSSTHAVVVVFEEGILTARGLYQEQRLWMKVDSMVSRRLPANEVQAIYNDGAWNLDALKRATGKGWPWYDV